MEGFCLYRHVRLDKNEPFYIGIGKPRRPNEKSGRSAWWKRIAKGGYRVDILLENLTWEQACDKEREFINLYGRRDLEDGTLVNMTDGGEGLNNPSESTREKLRKAKREMPEEHRQKLLRNLEKANRVNDREQRKTCLLNLQRAIKANMKPVLDTTTGRAYNSIKDAALSTGINYYTLIDKLRGRVTNNTTLRYA